VSVRDGEAWTAPEHGTDTLGLTLTGPEPTTVSETQPGHASLGGEFAVT